MARIALVLALLGSGLPQAAAASPHYCARNARQIAHYEERLGRARAIEAGAMEAKLQQHVDRLRLRASQRCPELAAGDSAGRAFAEFLKLAGKAAVHYFTFGAM